MTPETNAHRAFWADEVADAILERSSSEPIVIKGGVSPSGVPHLGHVNELLRGWFVGEVLRDRGYRVRQIFTSDDRDRLRSIPRQLATLDGEIVGLGDVDAGALGRNLGKPYTDIPDPFGCCDSYGAHFTTLLEQTADTLGIDVEFYSNTADYEAGAYDDIIRTILSDLEEARTVLGAYQAGVDEEYVPFLAQCSSCGNLTDSIEAIDLENDQIEYRCVDQDIGGQTIEGCGHEGRASIRAGKLPWRFEWPAQWARFGVDFEPFGKDHAEGSWPSGTDIAKTVLDIEPPEPLVYEWFTVGGEALSSSSGTLVTVEEVLELIELPVLRYFFTKNPKKARDLDLERINRLVEEFDEIEQMALGKKRGSEERLARAERIYPFLVDTIDSERIRIPYTFAAVLGMTDDPSLQREIATREGHIPQEASEGTIEEALERIELARTWARRMDNEFNYELKRSTMPALELDEATEQALSALATAVETTDDGETLQEEIYEIAHAHDIDVGTLFEAGYRLLFDKPEGPRLGPFLIKLDTEFVTSRLRLEG